MSGEGENAFALQVLVAATATAIRQRRLVSSPTSPVSHLAYSESGTAVAGSQLEELLPVGSVSPALLLQGD